MMDYNVQGMNLIHLRHSISGKVGGEISVIFSINEHPWIDLFSVSDQDSLIPDPDPTF
jgi:hypothetical protein